MFDLVDGIPIHPLVVHAVVVLFPLATLGTLAIAVRPRWRVTYGPLVVAAAAAATVLTPVATSSGQSLATRVGNPGEHAELGGQLLWFALPLLVLVAALVLVEWRVRRAATGPERAGRARSAGGRAGRLPTVLAALAVVAAVACSVQVYRIGESGARVVWGDVPAAR